MTRFEGGKKTTQQDTVKLRSSSNDAGEHREETVLTTSNSAPHLQRNEITIPIFKEGELITSALNVIHSPPISRDVARIVEQINLKDGEIIEKRSTEK